MLREAVKAVKPDLSKKPFLELYDQVALSLPKGVGFKPSGEMSGHFFSAATLLKCIKQVD
jgi:hypothetical protein